MGTRLLFDVLDRFSTWKRIKEKGIFNQGDNKQCIFLFYFFLNGLTFLTKGLVHKMLELDTVLVSDFLTFLNQPPENY